MQNTSSQFDRVAFALAPYACDPSRTRGRRFKEPPAPTRNDYQRDRDRIIHSTAFRRLVYKTQVFLNHEGDLFRTRMTHSLEVAQLARSVARVLRLSEDLVEAIALAHDLGHTPFGHAGQDALNACMVEYGGFEHNFQSLRVVDSLESRYPHFDGLNLTFETREGVLKHCSAKNAKYLHDKESNENWAKDDRFQSLGYRFLHHKQPSLEAQLCNLADEVAYNAHDIDDGIRSGLIDIEQLSVVSLFEEFKVQVLNEYPKLSTRKLAYETIRRMLSAQVYDIIAATQAAIEQHQVRSFEQVSDAPALVGFTDRMRSQSLELKRFLFQNLYRHPKVVQTTNWAKNVVTGLFQAYVNNPNEMPSPALDQASLHRSVADYIAGMTDRFASAEYARLCGQNFQHVSDAS
jgi:dGTPase